MRGYRQNLVGNAWSAADAAQQCPSATGLTIPEIPPHVPTALSDGVHPFTAALTASLHTLGIMSPVGWTPETANARALAAVGDHIASHERRCLTSMPPHSGDIAMVFTDDIDPEGSPWIDESEPNNAFLAIGLTKPMIYSVDFNGLHEEWGDHAVHAYRLLSTALHRITGVIVPWTVYETAATIYWGGDDRNDDSERDDGDGAPRASDLRDAYPEWALVPPTTTQVRAATQAVLSLPPGFPGRDALYGVSRHMAALEKNFRFAARQFMPLYRTAPVLMRWSAHDPYTEPVFDDLAFNVAQTGHSIPFGTVLPITANKPRKVKAALNGLTQHLDTLHACLETLNALGYFVRSIDARF